MLEIAQKDKRAFNQTLLYLNYINDASCRSLDDINFSSLLENVMNKIDIAKKDDLFDVGNLEDKLDLAIENGDIDVLHDVHSRLIEEYVTLNRDEVIKNVFFNLIYEGIYTVSIDALSEKAIEAIEDNDYALLFKIVCKSPPLVL